MAEPKFYTRFIHNHFKDGKPVIFIWFEKHGNRCFLIDSQSKYEAMIRKMYEERLAWFRGEKPDGDSPADLHGFMWGRSSHEYENFEIYYPEVI